MAEGGGGDFLSLVLTTLSPPPSHPKNNNNFWAVGWGGGFELGYSGMWLTSLHVYRRPCGLFVVLPTLK